MIRGLLRALYTRRRTFADVAIAMLVCWVASTIYFSYPALLAHYGVSLPHSSDNVEPYLLFDDLFRRNQLWAGWMFPEAPSYFPDFVVAWLLYAATGSLTAAIAAYAWASSLLFVLLARAVLLRAGSTSTAWLLWLGLWLTACAVGAHAAPGWLSHLHGYIFLPCIHSGTLLAALAGLALLLQAPANRGSGRAAILVLLAALVLVSDRIFVLQFILPAIALCAWLGLRRGSIWHRNVAVLLTILLVAYEFLRWLFGAEFGTHTNDRMSPMTALTGIVRDFGILLRNDPFSTWLIAAGLAGAVVALFARIPVASASSWNVPAQGMRLLAGFVLLAVLLPLAASLLLGRYHSLEEFRYLQTLGLLTMPLAALVIARVPAVMAARVYRIACGAVAGLAVVLAMTLDADRAALANYATDQEACLRDAVQRHGLTFGAATYWHANEMAARFARGPIIAPLNADAGPRMRTVVNLAWLGAFAERADELPVLGFVDEDGYSPGQLDRVFGKPASRIQCPRSAYRLYRPEDGALAHWYRAADWLPAQLLVMLGRSVVPAAAWAADDTFVSGDSVHASGRFDVAIAVLASVLDVPPGRVGVWFDYRQQRRGADAAVHWEVVALDESGNLLARLGGGVLEPAGALRRIDLALGERPQGSHVLGITIAVQGEVDLRVAAVGISVTR